MKSFKFLVKRHTKLFFKDKGLFFVSLITPLILLVLYITFLGNVLKTSFMNGLPQGFGIKESIVNAMVGGQLFASMVAVSCVTVAFTANMVMVQDKYTGARKDLLITPLNRSKLAISYYVSALLSTLIITLVASVACFIYIACVGWFMSFADCVLIILDVFILSMFGTIMSAVVNSFIKTQGQLSAVGTIVSSVYGFISGAYMPIASFTPGLQKTLMFLPSSYATSLVKNHAMNGVVAEFEKSGIPATEVEKIKDSMDWNIYFFGNKISVGAKYGIIIGTILLLFGIYILINYLKFKKFKKLYNKK